LPTPLELKANKTQIKCPCGRLMLMQNLAEVKFRFQSQTLSKI